MITNFKENTNCGLRRDLSKMPARSYIQPSLSDLSLGLGVLNGGNLGVASQEKTFLGPTAISNFGLTSSGKGHLNPEKLFFSTSGMDYQSRMYAVSNRILLEPASPKRLHAIASTQNISKG